MRKLGVVALVLAALFALVQAIALLEGPVLSATSMSSGLLTVALALVPPVGLALLATYLIVSRDSLASRWFGDEPVDVAIDAAALLRVALVFAGVSTVVQAFPSIVGVLASPAFDVRQVSILTGGESLDLGQAWLASIPLLLAPLLKLVLGVALITQSSRLTARLLPEHTAR